MSVGWHQNVDKESKNILLPVDFEPQEAPVVAQRPVDQVLCLFSTNLPLNREHTRYKTGVI